MNKDFPKILQGYNKFREKYTYGHKSVLRSLATEGQKPKAMVVSCCDSRVDPGLMLQCNPGELFIVRNVANIIPPYELDDKHHGTSAALEFGIRFLGIKELIILGHSNCGGIEALLANHDESHNDFISNWVSIVGYEEVKKLSIDDCARASIKRSYKNCLGFPWIRDRVVNGDLTLHMWFFDIKTGKIFAYSHEFDRYEAIEV